MAADPTSHPCAARIFGRVTTVPPPEDIDGSFVPRTKASVAIVELDGEGVLYDEERGQLHVLNQSATAVWACCDGTQTVDELSTELAEVFGLALADVTAGALEAIRDFASRGLLE
jgi:PqqD family protein of HPr-rel-A system